MLKKVIDLAKVKERAKKDHRRSKGSGPGNVRGATSTSSVLVERQKEPEAGKEVVPLRN